MRVTLAYDLLVSFKKSALLRVKFKPMVSSSSRKLSVKLEMFSVASPKVKYPCVTVKSVPVL